MPAVTPEDDPGNLRWREILPVAGGLFFLLLAYFFFYILPAHLEHLGASRAEVGEIMSMWGWASLPTLPVAALLMDRLGRRPFLVASGLLMAAVATGYAFAEKIGWPFYVLRGFQGIAFTTGYTAGAAVLADVSPQKDLPKVFLLTGVALLVTHGGGLALGEVIRDRWGFDAVCIAAATSALAAAAVSATVRDARPARETAATAPPQPRNGLFQGLAGGGLLPIHVYNFTEVAAFTSMVTFLPIFAPTRGVPLVKSFFLSFSLTAIVCRILFMNAPDRFGRNPVLGVSMIFYVALFALAPGLDAPWQLIPLGICLGVGVAFVNPLLNALAIERAGDPAAVARANGWFVVSMSLGGTLSPFGFGIVAERFGYETMYRAAGLLLLAGIGVYAAGEFARRD